MATLSITKSFSDDTLLSASDIDNIVDGVETLLNTTRLNDDNIEDESINASEKFKTATITTAKIQDSAVTTNKLADNSVTTAKINDLAVTTAKIAEGTLKKEKFYGLAPLANTGTTIMFHTFNGVLSIPRGWMICNGDLISESTYNAIHGAGAYAADSVADSDILGKLLPDMIDKYATGTGDTTETGSSAIATSGAPGNQANMSHNHTLNSHTHNDSKTLAQKDVWTGNLGADLGSVRQFPVASGTVLDDPLENSSVDNSVTTDIQPESIEFIYLMKVI